MSQRDYFEKDYYAILGVDKDASSEEIAKRYRQLARELHPDANPDNPTAEARFKEVGEAYGVLRNAEKRAEYDRVRDMVGAGMGNPFGGGGGFPGGAGSPGGGFPGGGFPGGARTAGGEAFDLGDILGGLFGAGAQGAGPQGRARQNGPRRGRDTEAAITLSFEDAYAGVTTTLRVYGRGPCSTCNGTGARPGTSPEICSTCGGTGTLARDQGMFSFSETCPTCRGSGRTIPDPCPTCDGSGAELRSREIRARIPAGVKDGARIRLKGKGEPGRAGAPAGDLIVTVTVSPHEIFERRGDDLHLRVPVTFSEAALGTRITVPTLDDPVTLKVPAGTESGRILRVRGRGFPRSGGGRGDLLVTVDVRVPQKLTRTQRKMIEDFGATEDPEALRARLDEHLTQEV